MSIDIRFANSSDQKVVAYIAQTGQRILSAVMPRMERAMIRLQRFVKASKLSGQVLKNRTGNLRRSVNYAVRQSGDTITGVVGVDPTGWYGKLHEYGGAFLRSNKGRGFGTYLRVRGRQRSVVDPTRGGAGLGRRAPSYTMMRSNKGRGFGTYVRFPARPFMRPSLAEQRENIVADVQKGVSEGLKA